LSDSTGTILIDTIGANMKNAMPMNGDGGRRQLIVHRHNNHLANYNNRLVVVE
jgi:hypothetical protein